MKSSYIAKPNEVERKWYVVDVNGLALGRAASQIASILRGKNKPVYTPHVDTGDYVIVVNAEKILLTGKKMDQKVFRHHSLYPGGLKEMSYKEAIERNPEKVFEEAVRRMLPHGPLGRQMFRKLKVYKGTEHNHEAQKPEVLELRY